MLKEATIVPEMERTNKEVVLSGDAFKSMLMQNRREETFVSKLAKSRKLTTIQLLATLEASLIDEAFSFNIEYLSLIRKEGNAGIEKVKKVSRVFAGFEFDQHYNPPTLKMEELEAMVQSFNKLSRNQTLRDLTPRSPELKH